MRWARYRNPNVSEPIAVIEAEIDLTDCLDLLDIWGFERLKHAYRDFSAQNFSGQWPLSVSGGQAQGPRTGAPVIQNFRDRDLVDWCAEAIGLHESPVRSVRAAFLWGKAVYPESFLFSRSHVQIAVRDVSIIENPKIHSTERTLSGA